MYNEGLSEEETKFMNAYYTFLDAQNAKCRAEFELREHLLNTGALHKLSLNPSYLNSLKRKTQHRF